MSFKNIFLWLSFLLNLFSCGVKGPPQAPPSTHILPWESHFLQPPPLIKSKNNFQQQLKENINVQEELITLTKKLTNHITTENKLDKIIDNKASSDIVMSQEDLISLCSNILNLREKAIRLQSSILISYHNFLNDFKKAQLNKLIIDFKDDLSIVPPPSQIMRIWQNKHYYIALNTSKYCTLANL